MITPTFYFGRKDYILGWEIFRLSPETFWDGLGDVVVDGGKFNTQPATRLDQGYTLVYAMVGMDVGFENPLFASIELSYEEVIFANFGVGIWRIFLLGMISKMWKELEFF